MPRHSSVSARRVAHRGFQFSIWDAWLNHSAGSATASVVFQFSIWDAEPLIVGPGGEIAIESFNSLFEMHAAYLRQSFHAFWTVVVSILYLRCWRGTWTSSWRGLRLGTVSILYLRCISFVMYGSIHRRAVSFNSLFEMHLSVPYVPRGDVDVGFNSLFEMRRAWTCWSSMNSEKLKEFQFSIWDAWITA